MKCVLMETMISI